MPGTFLNADLNFPEFSGEENTELKLKVIMNYLYMVLEQLRYTLSNLGMENLNKTELDRIGGYVTEPLWVQLYGENGREAAVSVTGEGLVARVSDAESGISALTQTAAGLSTRVENAVSRTSANQTGEGFSLTVQTPDGETAAVFDSGGLTVYSGGFRIMNGARETFWVNALGQAVAQDMRLNGALASGGTISGSEIIGGTVTGAVVTSESAAYDQRVQITEGDVRFYDAHGELYGEIRTDADGGRLFINSANGYVLKLGSSGDMSIDAEENCTVHIGTSSQGQTIQIGRNDGSSRINLVGDVFVNGRQI